MSDHIEWVSATERPVGYTAADLEEVSPDGNPLNEIGLRMGQSDGAMLCGSVRELANWLELAVLEVERIRGIEAAEKMAAATATIHSALSRDDETELGSEFEDKVSIIRSLNAGCLPGDNDGKPEPLNYEYCRGQVELLMDTTAWRSEYRPEKETVWLYTFGTDMP